MDNKNNSLSAPAMFHKEFKGKVFVHKATGNKYTWLQMFSVVENKLFSKYVKKNTKLTTEQGEQIITCTRNMIRGKVVSVNDKTGFVSGKIKNESIIN